ncbi:hypothetical protein MJO29_010335 [Puccinia striiformis f. sp. tritici]|nr:hypothetical protein MJO29_010335 [Puccinia striiformis f. sp. tritici]
MILCACSECIKNSPVDSNGQLQNGRYISSRTHLEHQVADLKKQHSFVERFSLQNQEPSYEQSESEALVLPSTSETTHDDELPAYMNTTLPDMAQLFLSWLHLHGSLSMETCKTARNFLLKVINKAQTTSHEAPLESIIPKDIRTILKHQVNIQIQQTVCCPTCFSLYDPPNLPDRCPYRQTTKGRPCNAPLFEVKKLFPGSSHQGKMQATRSCLRPKQFPTISLPCSVFYSQNFKSWITWFLSLKDIESAIEDWAQELQQNPTDTLTDIQQGTAWKGLEWHQGPQYPDCIHLVFSLFVDWFNPRGNKLAGKQQSVGIITMNCMNLPPTMQNRVPLTFLAGLTPGPLAPDITTISHLMRPLVDELVELSAPFNLNTYKHPNGRTVQVKLLPLIGDLGATHKVAGYASHSANYFCSWCKVHRDDREKLRLGQPRTATEVRNTSQSWMENDTVKGRDAIIRQTGVRYSELNRLTYRDPVKHVALGGLHNWMEGVLMHHFWERWGFQTLSAKGKRCRGEPAAGPNKRQRLDQNLNDNTAVFFPDRNNEEEEDDHSDIELNQGPGGLFTEMDMNLFRSTMTEIVLPTTIGCIPSQLGKAKCGKLKASQWYVLFVYVIPLIITDIFVSDIDKIDPKSNLALIMENIACLVQCTHIVNSRSVKIVHTQRFEDSYRRYNQTSKKIFENLTINPNHHYALHIPEQIKLWGPLGEVAEWTGERLIGKMHSIQTNHRMGELEGTMMKRFCQIQRLEAQDAFSDLTDSNKKVNEQSEPRGRAVIMDNDLYEQLLAYMQVTIPEVRHHQSLPHPIDACILQPDVLFQSTHLCNHTIRVSVASPNNCICFKVQQNIEYGFIHDIIRVTLPGHQSFNLLRIERIENRFCKGARQGSSVFRYWLYQMKTVIGQVFPGRYDFIPTSAVQSIVAYRRLPNNTYGLNSGGVMMVPVNHLSVLQINSSNNLAEGH